MADSTSRDFFSAQSDALSKCFDADHAIEEVAHINHEEFLFTCKTCDKDYAVITERFRPVDDEW